MPVYDGLSSHAALLFVINVVLWLAALALGKAWPVDFIWSSWPILHLLMLAASIPGVSIWSALAAPRIALLATAVCIWGLRLTFNFISRGGIGHEDWRYSDQRAALGRWYWLVSLVSVFLGQSYLMFAGCLSLYPAVRAGSSAAAGGSAAAAGTGAVGALGAHTVCGFAICMGAVLLEAMADRALDAFVASAKAARATGDDQAPKVMPARGLFAWCRRPNYFGEWSFWVGLWLMGGEGFSGGWSWLGPAILLALFLFVSVGLIEERMIKRKGAAYRRYMRAVPSKFFPLPPAVQRACCGGGEGRKRPAAL